MKLKMINFEKQLNISLDKQIAETKLFKESLQIKVDALEDQILELKEQMAQEAMAY